MNERAGKCEYNLFLSTATATHPSFNSIRETGSRVASHILNQYPALYLYAATDAGTQNSGMETTWLKSASCQPLIFFYPFIEFIKTDHCLLNAQIINGKYVFPAHGKHEQHFYRPAANTFNLSEVVNYFFIIHLPNTLWSIPNSMTNRATL